VSRRILHVLGAAALILSSPWSAGAQSAAHLTRPEDQQAGNALFVRSDLPAAARIAQEALRANPLDRNALFVQMETAALRADEFTELKSAITLVSSPGREGDPRIQIALGHISSRAANTAAFQAIAPRLLKAMEGMPAYSSRLALALLTAEEDGYQRLTSRNLAQLAGLLTDWKFVGGFGKFSNLAFDQKWPPESDLLHASNYDGHAAESFHFENGIAFVPDYLTENGVLYACSEITEARAGTYLLKVESRGTMQVRVNGSLGLLKEDRFIKGPEVQTAEITLHEGKNRIFLKLLPSAAPFRISINHVMPRRAESIGLTPKVSSEERTYINFAARYWEGNYAAAEKIIESQKTRSAPLLFLAAQLYASESLDSGSEVPLLLELLQRIPEATAAELILAERAYGSEQYEESLLHLGHALAGAPNSPKVQELRYELASHFGWEDERKDAIRKRLSLHPSCAAISEAEKFYSNSLQLKRASELDAHLEHCSSVPSLYWEALNRRGNPQLALSSMFLFSRAHPLDRSVRLKLVRQLVEMGAGVQALQEAKALATLSPNSGWFKKLVESPELILDGPAHTRRLKEMSLFQPYRRNALEAFGEHDSAPTKASAEILFDDRVVAIHSNQTADLYYHRVVRVWNKAAITEFGEVTLPRGAELLELRTLRQNGGIAEPELTDNKHSVSMPSLIAGNAVEIEYLQHFDSYTRPDAPPELSAVFGAQHAQVQDARYVLMYPAGHEPVVHVSASAGRAVEEKRQNLIARSWHFLNLPPFSPEPAMSGESDRPEVRLLSLDHSLTDELPFLYRNDLIEAAQVTRRIQTDALKLRRQTPRETAEAIYAYVMSAARSSDDDWIDGVTSADETLETGDGSRSALLLAFASALGIRADLLLSAEAGSHPDLSPGYSSYRHPLVRLRFAHADGSNDYVLLDPLPDSLAAGAITPTLQGQPALVIPPAHDGSVVEQVIVRSNVSERSVAVGDLFLNQDGGLEATIDIELGSWRSAQVRSGLRQLPEAQPQSFFEELTAKIFAGAVDVKGEVLHQNDLTYPMKLRLSCRVPHFSQWENNEAEIRQLIPQLSLRSMYAALPSRKYSLFIDTPLQETTTFTLHLPDEIGFKISPQATSITTEFGTFKTSFQKLDGRTLQVVRDFDISVQTIPPERYQDFAGFANQTEQADRQEIVLTRTLSAKANGSIFERH
jgi:Domain of Unknown Function with PDB structure (DUF3858)